MKYRNWFRIFSVSGRPLSSCKGTGVSGSPRFNNAKKENKVYQRDIGFALNLRRATLSEILKTMERNKLISRVPDKTDTRIKQIILSENTKEKFNAVKQTLDETEKALLKNINKKDLEIFLKVISQMQENLKEERMDIC